MQTLQAARSRLVGYGAVRAKIDEAVHLGPKPFRVSGVYLQGARLRLRLEYRVNFAGAEGSLLEVCDGQVLWTRLQIDKQTRVTRRDVQQILAATAGTRNLSKTMLAFELGLGGLPAMLASLERTMEWQQRREEEVNGREAIVIEGRWKAEFRNRWKQLRMPPAYIPDGVRVAFDRTHLFPMRLEYFREVPGGGAGASENDAASGNSDNKAATTHVLVTLNISDVVFDPTVRDEDFTFVPPDGVQFEDVTRYYLEKLPGAAGGAASTAPEASGSPPVTPPQ